MKKKDNILSNGMLREGNDRDALRNVIRVIKVVFAEQGMSIEHITDPASIYYYYEF